jgi:hypothetical protein
MYVARPLWPSSNGKSYESIYLRESFRDGPHVRIPTPNPATLPLLKALNIQIPKLLPHTETRVVTRKKLPQRRQVR